MRVQKTRTNPRLHSDEWRTITLNLIHHLGISMSNTRYLKLLIIFFVSTCLVAVMPALVSPVLAKSISLVPAAPKVKAHAYLLMDFNSNSIIVSQNADKRVEPASLTKLMTIYVTLYELSKNNIKLDDKVKISEKAWRMKGSRMFIKVNSWVSIDELLHGVIIQSGNDASVALAEHIAGSESAFADLMNQHAVNLGLLNTHFVNSTGWPSENHYTTANDLAVLTRALINDFKDFYALFKIKHYTHNGIKQPNRNRLLWTDDRVDGVKTGHTESAGYCLVSSATQNDMRLIAVVTGTNSETIREASSRKLLSYGFRFYETFLLNSAHTSLTNQRVWKGDKEELTLGLTEDLYITAPKGNRSKIKANMKLDAMITAPVSKGQKFGTVNVMLGEELLTSRPLVSLADVKEGGFFSRLIDNIILMFK